MMKIKICGLKEAENIAEITALNPDFVGFICYPPSPRFIGKHLKQADFIQAIPKSVKKVGVFVNESISTIISYQGQLGLDFIQLHGNESPEDCQLLQQRGLTIIKAFAVDNQFDFEKLFSYEAHCAYFLFDTPTIAYGGSGRKFDWEVLTNYKGSLPFFLSGGIAISDIPEIKQLSFKKMVGIDVNSKLELAPGLKCINSAKEIIQLIKN